MELLNDINLYLPAVIVAVAGLVTMMLAAFDTPRKTIYWASILFVAVALVRSYLDMFGQQTTAFSDMIAIGGVASFGTFIVLIGTLFTLLLCHDYFKSVGNYDHEIYPMILFGTTGMIVLATANDLVTLFLGIETMSIALYVLAGLIKSNKRSIEAALKYFLLGAFATGFLLYGIALLYGASGATSYSAIAGVTNKDAIYWFGVALLLSGFFFKLSIVPFHMWAPDVYTGSPTPITGYMATAAKSAAFIGFVLVLSQALQSSQAQWSEVLKILAVLTMIIGNIVAMVQSNVKRMLAYSSIAHAGYVLIGLATGTIAGYNAVLFYLFAYTVMNVGAFGVIAYYERTKGVDMTILDNYSGLGFKNPLMGVLMSVFLFSLVGIPPMVGFIGKYLVFAAAIQSGFIVLAVIGMLASAAGAFYYLRVMVFMYMKESETEFQLEKSGNVYALSLTILAVTTIVFGIIGNSLLTIITSF